MRKYFSRAGAAIVGLGLLGGVTLLDFLFGDAVLIRAYQSMAGSETIVPPRPDEPESKQTEPVVPVDPPVESLKTGSELLDRICGAGRMTLNFPVRKKDPARYKRRAGTQIVAVPACYEHDKTFGTRVESGGWSGEGIVAGRRLEFRYRFSDSEGIADCRVVAEDSGSRLKGSISCESSSDAMDPREVEVEIDSVEAPT
jgi:hypothetical protein